MSIIKEVLSHKYEDSANNIEQLFRKATKKSISDKVTKLDLIKFVALLQDEYAPATARQYAARMKAVLNAVNDTVRLPNGYDKILSPKAHKNVNAYLTDDEIVRFSEYEPATEKERMVQAIFLLECYTGARTSDCARMDDSSIVDGMVDYVSLKTKTHAVVPCKPIVERIIRSGANRCATVADSTKGIIIRSICKKQGISNMVKVFLGGEEKVGEKYEFITSHTGRRSFATNLYLKGCDLYTLSKMMGHADVKMTESYLCCDGRMLTSEVLSYFQ